MRLVSRAVGLRRPPPEDMGQGQGCVYILEAQNGGGKCRSLNGAVSLFHEPLILKKWKKSRRPRGSPETRLCQRNCLGWFSLGPSSESGKCFAVAMGRGGSALGRLTGDLSWPQSRSCRRLYPGCGLGSRWLEVQGPLSGRKAGQ